VEESGIVRNQLVPTRGIGAAPIHFDSVRGTA
jgi:hypothetical protein